MAENKIDCRSCFRYNSEFKKVKENIYHCSYNGEFFNNEFGKICWCYENKNNVLKKITENILKDLENKKYP